MKLVTGATGPEVRCWTLPGLDGVRTVAREIHAAGSHTGQWQVAFVATKHASSPDLLHYSVLRAVEQELAALGPVTEARPCVGVYDLAAVRLGTGVISAPLPGCVSGRDITPEGAFALVDFGQLYSGYGWQEVIHAYRSAVDGEPVGSPSSQGYVRVTCYYLDVNSGAEKDGLVWGVTRRFSDRCSDLAASARFIASSLDGRPWFSQVRFASDLLYSDGQVAFEFRVEPAD